MIYWVLLWVQIISGTAFSIAGGKFAIDSDGNIMKIRNVTYSWPSSPPSTGQVLTCSNGSTGAMTWSTPTGGGGTPGDTVTYETSFGANPSAGTSNAYSRADHTHGTPANPVTAHESSYNHALLHSNSNDPTADQKAALAGTSGTPSSANKYVTNSDSRLTAFSGSAAGLVPTSAGGTSNYLRADGAWAAPSGGGGTTPAWKGVVAANWGDGDPNVAIGMAMTNGTVAPTPTNIGTSVARCSYFMLDTSINVQKIRWYGVGAVSAIYHIAVYRNSDSARITSDHEITTAAATWGSVSSTFTLNSNTLYLACVSADTTGTTAGMLAMDPTTAATTGQMVLPTDWPGSLDIDAASPKINPIGTCQFAVTSGALPATAPSRSNRSGWTGGMPLLIFDSNGA